MSTTIERISAHRVEVERTAAADYRALVHAVETGSEGVGPVEAIRILKAAGKTEADLSAAVALIRKRRADAAEAAKLSETERALNTLDAESTAAIASLEAAKEEYRTTIHRIIHARPALLAQHASSLRAQGDLQATCGNADILRQERSLDAESTQVNRERDSILLALSSKPGTTGGEYIRLTHEAKGAESEVKNFFRSVGFNSPGVDAAAACKKRDDYLRQHIEPLRKRLATIESRRSAILKQIGELQTAKMEA